MRKTQQRHRVPIEDLDFLASKFLLIIPQHLQGDRARIGFQLEKAFWRYINQFEEEKVARMENYFQLRDFALQMFPRVPFLRDHVDIVEEVISDFMDYKRSVPTYGVILLNSPLDKVLLVHSIEDSYADYLCKSMQSYLSPRTALSVHAQLSQPMHSSLSP